MKVLFLQDHLKENHVKQVDGTLRNVYFQTQAGKILKRTAEETLKLKGDEYYIDYAYQLVPKVVQRDKFNRAIRYKKVSLTEARPEFELLYERIIREKPDIIVPQGNLGCSALLKKNGIKSLRGVPQKVVVRYGNDFHEVWVLPTFSIEYMLVDYKVNNLVAADFSTLGKYIDQGDVAFESETRDYEFVDSIERVREIFKTILPAAPIVAWDLETNTLHPEKTGAKPLVISLSWQEGTGCTIPLEHKEFTWLPENLAEIYEYIKAFVADPDIIKVGHNIQFDIRFLKLTKGFTDFCNHRDTKVMYYLLVDQDKDASLKLSNLSYEMTDMGGYDKPLEDFKKRYVEDYVAKERARINQLKEDYKKEVARERASAKEEKRKAQLPPKPKFPKVTPPVNEIDGSDFNYEWIPLESILSVYAAGDVDACLRIHNFLEKKGQAEENAKIRKLYTEHYTELSAYLAKVEAAGVQMNTDYTRGLIDAYTEEEDRLLQLIRKFPEVQKLEEEHEALYMKGLEEWSKPKAMRNEEIAKLRDKYKKKLIFNPNSSEDKQKSLYKYTGYRLPYNKELVVKSAFEDGISEDELEWYHYKADKTALEYIKENFEDLKELADLLLTHSLVKTRKQNFTYKLLGLVNDKKRLYGTFNPTGTETTRLSSRDPNLQQIPRKTGNVKRFDYKHPIKRMFVTSFAGGALLQLDYSSLESRILGLAAGDEEMTQQFLDGRDLHKETATFVYGVSMDQVTEDMRSMAKAVTFGLAYGETPFSFAPKNNMSVEEAEVIFQKYFQNKPKVKQFIDATHAQVKKDGFVECMQGFRRNLRNVFSQDKSKVNEALRQSVNTKIQGSGAFLTNSSVILIIKFIEKNNLRSKVVLTVHDSIVIDCPPEEIHIMAHAAKHIMENLPIDWLFIDWKGERLRYPIKADVEIGTNYNDMVAYDKDDLNSFKTVQKYCDFYLAKKEIKNHKETGTITEERYDELKELIDSRKPAYQEAV